MTGDDAGRLVKTLIRALFRRFGFEIRRYRPPSADLPDLSPEQNAIIARVKPFTMTESERLAALITAVEYIVENNIPGDVVECGVWRGGSMMAVALTLLARGDRSRSLYLYDTFAGMPAPTGHDRSFDGRPAEEQLRLTVRGEGVWCYADLEDVRTNLLSTGYPADKIHFVRGKVEDTLPGTIPGRLALLRLDTDWYESTLHELRHLYPILETKGCLIIDDYGHWQGARKATDEYFRGQPIYLNRVDYTARLVIKF